MITVPGSLKAKIRQLRGRKLTARCRIDFSDSTIDNTVLAYSNGHNNISQYSQIYNGIEDVTKKWFSLDGHSILDGTFYIAPSTDYELSENEIGWWSESISTGGSLFENTDGVLFGDSLFGEELFSTGIKYPSLVANFTSRTLSSINVAFDNARMEYASDFAVNVYTSSGLAYQKNVTGNTGTKYTTDIDTVTGAIAIEVVLKSWSIPHANAKIAELFTSVFIMYNGKDILDLQIIEQAEDDSGLSALGTVMAGQCNITLYNRNREWDYDNPSSRIYNLVRKGIKVIPEIGDGTNWIPLGTFYAEEIDTQKKSLEVSISALDIIARLGDSQILTASIISAPSPSSYLIDTGEEWGGGSTNGIEVSGSTIRMVFN